MRISREHSILRSQKVMKEQTLCYMLRGIVIVVHREICLLLIHQIFKNRAMICIMQPRPMDQTLMRCCARQRMKYSRDPLLTRNSMVYRHMWRCISEQDMHRMTATKMLLRECNGCSEGVEGSCHQG